MTEYSTERAMQLCLASLEKRIAAVERELRQLRSDEGIRSLAEDLAGTLADGFQQEFGERSAK